MRGQGISISSVNLHYSTEYKGVILALSVTKKHEA